MEGSGDKVLFVKGAELAKYQAKILPKIYPNKDKIGEI
jgi:hypothetical protein